MKYDVFKQETASLGTPPPLGEGVLILDEVKVVGKICWNSKNGKLSGIAMDGDALGSLKDLHADFGQETGPAPAEYFLQFLWRDLSSDFDVIGPHYNSTKTMTSTFTHACLQDALSAFQSYNFLVRIYNEL